MKKKGDKEIVREIKRKKNKNKESQREIGTEREIG